MKNEFEKLDKFMLENRPAINHIPFKKSLRDRQPKWIGIAVAFGLSAIIATGVIRHHQMQAESAVLLSEVLDWDVTAIDYSTEIDTELAMLEY